MLKIGICGAAGRMGKSVIALCDEIEQLKISAAIEHKESGIIGTDVGEQAGVRHLGVAINDDLASVAGKFDVLIDFTVATSVLKNLEKCRAAKKPVVIGTTGLSDTQKVIIKQISEDIPIVLAPNMSIGVNLCVKLLKIATSIIGKEADIEVIEAHHRNKQDAPSGTALQIGETIANTLGYDLADCATYNRHGIIGERPAGNIGFSSIRAGDIVGEHTVIFAMAGERIEIKHAATTRNIFARGAVRAAQWLISQKCGLFDMQDVLGSDS